MKRIIRYISIAGNRKFDTLIKYELESSVWILEEKPLKVPYIKLKIKVIGKEKRFIGDRKKHRFLFFGKKEN